MTTVRVLVVNNNTSTFTAMATVPISLPLLLPSSNTTITTSTAPQQCPQTSPLDNADIVRLVVSFIGRKHYRFIAMINQSFYTAHSKEFPMDKRTAFNASTIECAKISCDESKYHLTDQQKRKLLHSAAIHGSLPDMQYLRSLNCEWSTWICATLAQFGHLHALQYAHENGCPWDVETCALAARSGHLHVLQYAHENGCPWNEWTRYFGKNKRDVKSQSPILR